MAEDLGAEGGIVPETSSDGSASGDSQPTISPVQPEKPSSQILSNDDIENLLAGLDADGRGAGTPESIVGSEEEATPLSPVDSTPPSDAPKDLGNTLLSNDDLENLLAAMESGTAEESISESVEEAPAAPSGQTTNLLSNADIEKLLEGMAAGSDSAASPTAFEDPVVAEDSPVVAPVEPAAPAGEQSSEVLNAAELDTLRASVDAHAKDVRDKRAAPKESVEPAAEEPMEEPQAPAPPAGKQTTELLSNADIEKLMESMNARPAPDVPVEVTPPEVVVPAGKQTSELLSNADIENLLASMNAPPVADEADVVEAAPPEAAVPGERQTTELLNNADIENLLASMNAPPAADEADVVEATVPDEGQISELLSNADIENLLAGVDSSIKDAPEASQAVEPVPPAGEQSAEVLSNADLEDLLSSMDNSPAAAPTVPAAEETTAPDSAGETSAEVLNNDDIENLLANLDSSQEASAEPVEEPAPVAEQAAEVLDSADLESLLTTFEGGSDSPEAAADEQPVPAATSAATKEAAEAQGEPLPQELLDSLVRGARHRQGGPEQSALPETPPSVKVEENPVVVKEASPTPPPEKERVRKPAWISTRLAASLALGFFSGACVYLYLASHPYRAFDAEAMQELRVTVPGQALGVAAGLAEGDRYSEARKELKPVLSSLPPGEARTNAEYLDTEAAIRLLPDEAKIPVLKELIHTIDRLLTEAPNHPKAGEALLWKAELLKRSDMPEAAYEVYSQILAKPENPPGFDKGLLGAATTALRIERPNDAINHLRRLLQAFPSSPLRDEAEYWLGDAYLASGDMEAGRMTLMSVARAHPDSALGAEAFARLGGLSYDAGDYDEAIRLFEMRLQTATKVAGNDKIYLLLARAHRVKGELAQAERVLRELVQFFPESAQIPAALVELSQVLDGLGRRDEAVQIAKQAAQQYASDPDVLANAGHFLANTGEAAAGADTLVAAEQAGAENPAVLLEAARQYRSAKELDKAAEIYQRILDDYSNSTEAFRSGIELARVDYEKGRVRAALTRMEENAADAKGRPAHAEALDALASLYDELGLRNRATETFREMAGETSDPVLLARAAATLFDAGEEKDALTLVGRIDKGALPEPLAYGLLMREGAAMAQSNPEQALALMEQAYQGYPNDRKPEDVQLLLDSYLALDRTAAARALVVDAETRAKANPAEIPTLEAAAARWGDYLFGKGDFTAAGEGYAMAAAAAGGDAKAARSETSLWSRFQQANCLLRLENLAGSLPLYEEVAGSTSRWGDLARAKADYVGLEMRRRGIAPPAPTEPVPPASEG